MVEGKQERRTRVRKVNSAEGDAHQDGALARIRGTVGQMPLDAETLPGVWGYMVEWDDIPGIPVFIAGTRLDLVEEDA
jgi:hypothetical protein